MKLKIPQPSPAMGVALVALFISLGGSAFAFSHDSGSSASAEPAGTGGKLTLRFGKLVDTDSTAFDGSSNYAVGHATCKRGERVISGGVRQIAGGAGVISHIWTVESGPVPKKRGWYASMNSDLGGAARKDFLVVATCEQK
jgi:hypothetical protein